MKVPEGYIAVEWADDTVHAIDLDSIPDEGPTWRSPVVCGSSGPGVSSDEGGPSALRVWEITCMDCKAILS